ncbi:MAG: adenosylcobinamide-phosphate synthase CbiB [Planifilum fimeticola]|jgi:adenosylcobinamide-phosphate synthase
MKTALLLLAAYGLDRILGDPRWLPHPVVGMGKAIRAVERMLRLFIGFFGKRGMATKGAVRLLGCSLPLIVAGGVYVAAAVAVSWVEGLTEWGAWLLEVLLLWTTVATKGLADEAKGVDRALAKGDLPSARRLLQRIVGRDTNRLDEPEIVRGTVETVAENIVDAVTSPLFYAAIGGAPLAMAYRAVNTLDSMVGYRNERYRDLGWASARLDDGANWLPARLTVGPMLLAFRIVGLDPRRAWQILRRDGRKHPSPNSGIPESLMAGGLGIRLGGTNTYDGVPSHRPHLGDPVFPKQRKHIREALRVLHWTTLLYVAMLGFVCLVISGLETVWPLLSFG